MLSGHASVLVVTVVVFWVACRAAASMHRFVGTEFEPYVGVAFTAGVALSFTLTLSGMLDLLG